MKAIRLRTEYLKNPIGVDFKKPRLFWNCEGGLQQAAYQIFAKDSNGSVLWDSGKVCSPSMRAWWGGRDVAEQTRVIWKIRIWDGEDPEEEEPEWSEEAFFETGLPSGIPWKAKWITGNYKVNRKLRYPVDCFRKEITISGPLEKARLYITACGLYEAKLDGEKVGSFVLAPGYTDYRKRIQYQTYDVTEGLSQGTHELTVQLADGWFRGSVGAWGRKNAYGTETKLLACLDLFYADGRRQSIVTDSTWQWSADGPIRFADNKDGEIVEAFRSPFYDRQAKETFWKAIPCCSDNVPVTEHEKWHPVIKKSPNGRYLVDFGQNIAGYVRFRVDAHVGERMIWRFGEMLDQNGNLTQKNIQCHNKRITTPLQKIDYTCAEGLNNYSMTFAIFGFQYAEVEMTPGTDIFLDPEQIEAVAVYSDIEQTGFFSCSHELVNRLFESTVWSTKNNSCDIPTDCPTRERHGWTGDAQIFSSTANYLFDYMAFSQKYLRDVYDWQKKDGKLPQIAPEGGTDPYMRAMNGSVGWADAGVIIPYVLWKQYGDKEVLERFLPGMRKYAAFMQHRCGKWYPTARSTGLRGDDRKYLSNYGQAYGEWAEPDDVHHMTWKDCAVPHPEVATAYTAYIMQLMSEIEKKLGNEKESRADEAFSVRCRNSYQALARKESYSLNTDRQARLVRPLAMHLLDREQTVYAKERLIEALEHYGWRVGTGFLSTPFILDVLTEIDPSYAYRLLENEELPGWLYMPKHGATTIWEAWEGSKAKNGGIASLDHYSKGAVCRWFFDTMCGIRIDGENHFTIRPVPGGKITNAAASYNSVYGKVESRWEVDGEKRLTRFTVTIPSNCSADVILPDGTVKKQGPGTLQYEEAMAKRS